LISLGGAFLATPAKTFVFPSVQEKNTNFLPFSIFIGRKNNFYFYSSREK
jgi:hypothetical protein